MPEYSAAKSPDSIGKAPSVSARMARSGWSSRIRFSISTYEDSSPDRWSGRRLVPLDECPHRENHACGANTTDVFNNLLPRALGSSYTSACPLSVLPVPLHMAASVPLHVDRGNG
jgi:hypothetical protein